MLFLLTAAIALGLAVYAPEGLEFCESDSFCAPEGRIPTPDGLDVPDGRMPTPDGLEVAFLIVVRYCPGTGSAPILVALR